MVLASGALDGADLTALRALMYGAPPMPEEVQRRVLKASAASCTSCTE